MMDRKYGRGPSRTAVCRGRDEQDRAQISDHSPPFRTPLQFDGRVAVALTPCNEELESCISPSNFHNPRNPGEVALRLHVFVEPNVIKSKRDRNLRLQFDPKVEKCM